MFTKISSNNDPQKPNPGAPQPANAPAAPANAPAAHPQPSAQQPQAAPAQQTPAAPARQAAAPASAGTTNRNTLSNDVEIKGKVRFANDLLVDGRIEGEIASEGSLTVGENAHIKAEIRTRSVTVYGKVHGNIIATERVEIKGGAEMVGDIKGAILSIEPGAIFVGKSEVGSPSATAKPAAGTPAARPAAPVKK